MKRFRASRLFVATLVASFIGTIAGLGYLAYDSKAAMHSMGGVASSVSPTAFPLLAPNGTAGAESYSFTSFPTAGMFMGATNNRLILGTGGAAAAGFAGNGGMVLGSNGGLFWSTTTDPDATIEVALFRDAANTVAQKNAANAQTFRVYATTTGPVHWGVTARTAGALYTATGGAAQVSYTQTTVPTCSASCGTSPSVVGTDTAGIVTMGSSGVPASGWVVTFNGTWPAAPSCIVQSALAGMVVGKMPIVVATTTTTMTVTTNGTAPATNDKYAFHCYGVS